MEEIETQLVESLVASARAGHWTIFAGFMLMCLLGVARGLFKDNLPRKYLPLLAQVLGVMGSIAASLTIGMDWPSAVISGVAIGSTASGLWSFVGKYVMPRKR